MKYVTETKHVPLGFGEIAGGALDEQAERTGLSRSALSNYETNESKEVSQFALVALAKFYGVSTDYLLGLSALENPMQGDIHDLNISSEMAELLKSGKINNRLLDRKSVV